MGFEARRQFAREAGRYPVDYALDPCRGLPPAEVFYQTPASAGFSRVSACDLASPESNYPRNPQGRGLYDEMLKVGERKLNVNTRPNRFVDYHRMDDFVDEDNVVGAEVKSPRNHEANLCFSPLAKGRMGSIPIHKWGSSPTSVLDSSGDAWNLLYDTPGRINPMDLHNHCDLPSHLMERSSYLVARQMGSPRSPTYNRSPFTPKANVYPQGALPNLCGMDSEMANWSHNGYGMMGPLMQGRHQTSKLVPPVLLQQDRGFQPHSNSRTPMRAVFVTERPGKTRESSGTGVFLPRCVGGGPDFNRKPVCAPVLLPIWNEEVPSSPSRKPLDNSSNPRKTAAAHCHPFSQPLPSGSSQQCFTINNTNGSYINSNTSNHRHRPNSSSSTSNSDASKIRQECSKSASFQAEEHNLEGLDLPPEWVY